jgi:hypothetical protein
MCVALYGILRGLWFGLTFWVPRIWTR